MKAKSRALCPQEAKLVKRLRAAPGRKCSVAQLAVVLFPAATMAALRKDPRKMHQRVGTLVFRANKKLVGERIVPGDTPRSYSL